ncbi:hypothetical protein HOLleu_02731 [Holothuria leucospilota]|uniref:BEN domain-containing protein n=1 Tax=Holothuria leucospilota TaxID=206669 RepID=A0A9Q1CQ07_HOLLE|nr:hypothetical protein HOLleu_02731 [Holothuria leucospilota]
MEKVGIRWLEPDTHIGKTSFVQLKNVSWNISKDMPAGTVVKARWKSTNKAYRAVLMDNIFAECKEKGRLIHSTRDNSSTRSENGPASNMETAMVQQMVGFDSEQKDAKWKVRQLEEKLDRLEEKVCKISTQVEEMKQSLKSELDRMRVVLIGGQWGIVQQLQRIEMGVNKSHSEAQETQRLIHAQTERTKSDMVQEDMSNASSLVENGKRMQPMIGLIENGYVMAQHKERKIPLAPCDRYRKMLENSKTATSFLRKLMKCTFTDEELAESNYSGGTVMSINGMVVKKSLDHGRLLALFAQVELEFPSSTKGDNFAKIRETVNEECRRLASKFRDKPSKK